MKILPKEFLKIHLFRILLSDVWTNPEKNSGGISQTNTGRIFEGNFEGNLHDFFAYFWDVPGWIIEKKYEWIHGRFAKTTLNIFEKEFRKNVSIRVVIFQGNYRKHSKEFFVYFFETLLNDSLIKLSKKPGRNFLWYRWRNFWKYTLEFLLRNVCSNF